MGWQSVVINQPLSFQKKKKEQIILWMVLLWRKVAALVTPFSHDLQTLPEFKKIFFTTYDSVKDNPTWSYEVKRKTSVKGPQEEENNKGA